MLANLSVSAFMCGTLCTDTQALSKSIRHSMRRIDPIHTLSHAGYSTHLVGKWHLGHYTLPSTPTHRGFDSFFGFYHRERDHFTHAFNGFLDSRQNEEVVREHTGNYSTHMYARVWNFVLELVVCSPGICDIIQC